MVDQPIHIPFPIANNQTQQGTRTLATALIKCLKYCYLLLGLVGTSERSTVDLVFDLVCGSGRQQTLSARYCHLGEV